MRINAFVTTTALACVLLAGCTDDPVGPVDGDTSAPTTSATPTPTGPTPPPLPDAAKANTADGAIAFVAHYVALMNYSATTGDTTALSSLSTSCSLCSKYIDLYEDIQNDGGYSGDPGWVSEPTVSELVGEDFTVLTDIKTQEYTYKLSDTAQEIRVEPTTYPLRFQVGRTNGAFTMKSIDQQVAVPTS